MTWFAHLASAARDALKVDGVAKAGSSLLRQGLSKSMLTASNPQLLDALFNLMTATLDSGNEVWKDPKILASEVNFLAQQLEQRQVYDMKPFARKLRDRYAAQPYAGACSLLCPKDGPQAFVNSPTSVIRWVTP